MNITPLHPKLGVTLVTVFRGGLCDESRRGRGETLTSDSQGDKNLGIQIYNGNITLAPHNGGFTSHFMNGLHTWFLSGDSYL